MLFFAAKIRESLICQSLRKKSRKLSSNTLVILVIRFNFIGQHKQLHVQQRFSHYENLPMQFTEIFSGVENLKFL